MGEHVIKLPDVGEGVAEAELVEWHVKVGDLVREDALLAAVMTDKATVEIPSPADGEVLWLGAEIGETVAVGSPIVRLKVAGEGNAGRWPRRSCRRRLHPLLGRQNKYPLIRLGLRPRHLLPDGEKRIRHRRRASSPLGERTRAQASG